MMASRGSESEPGDIARFVPFASLSAEGYLGARSPFTFDIEPWCPLRSEAVDEEDLAK